MKGLQKLRKISAAALLFFMLHAAKTNAESWINLQPAYNTDSRTSALRIEAGKRLSKQTDFYTIHDFDAKTDNKDSFNYFGGFNLTHGLGNSLFIEFEYRGDIRDTNAERLGLVKQVNLGKKNTTWFTWHFGAGDTEKSTFKLYTMQKINNKLTSLLSARYNPKQQTFYLEPELNIKLNHISNFSNNVTLSVQGRGFGTLEDTLNNMQYLVGIKYGF